ncbi:AHH domain-containing protein [Altererythrobacter sp. ZODW24]|uniref:AHH domain-containing protein n=1 Tax=Altererythrobacter sp. ZODW24 TaxID=2185142 RepID=UPI000DF84E24|nr:AHH domain-containing protein [Altererythrobacter sp. ZODW24]
MQKHHLVPRQILANRSFGPLFAHIGQGTVGYDDFRRNGVLLPARENAVRRTGLPLHRGPHRVYSEMVAERMGQIEGGWAELRGRAPEVAVEQAIMRLGLLQRALRKRLVTSGGKRLILNRKDPLGTGFDFSTLDAMAELL